MQHIDYQTWRKVGNRQKIQVNVTTKTIQRVKDVQKRNYMKRKLADNETRVSGRISLMTVLHVKLHCKLKITMAR